MCDPELKFMFLEKKHSLENNTMEIYAKSDTDFFYSFMAKWEIEFH